MQTGVGLKVEWCESGYIIVELVRKGAAHRSQVLKKGYRLVSIDGVVLSSRSISLPSLILGLPGTPVVLGYVQGSEGAVKYVELIRGDGGTMASRDPSSDQSKETENTVNEELSSSSRLDSSLSRTGQPHTEGGDTNSPKKRRVRCVAMLPGDSFRPRVSAPPQWIIDETTPEERARYQVTRPSHKSGTYNPSSPSAPKLGKQQLEFSPSNFDENVDWISVEEVAACRDFQLEFNDQEPFGDFHLNTRTPEAKMQQAEARRERELEAKERQESMGLAAGIVGGRFGTGPKSDMDRLLQAAKAVPPVGLYHAAKQFARAPGGRFGTSKRFVDSLPVESTVGPGAYSPEPCRSKSSCKFAASERSTELDRVMSEARKLPGPGDYFDESDLKGSESVPLMRTVSGWQKSNNSLTSKSFTSTHVRSSGPGPGAYDIVSPRHTRGALLNQGSVSNYLDTAMHRAAKLPGPADYQITASWKGPGGKFSMSVTKSEVDLRCREAARMPGPGAYRPRSQSQASSYKMASSRGKTAIELAAKASSRIPGPGHYGVPEPLQSEKNSGRFGSAVKCSLIEESAALASRFPGPGQYGAPARIASEKGAGKFGTSVRSIAGQGGSIAPGPGTYEAPFGLPRADRLPESQSEWRALRAIYPEMRFR